MHNRPAPALCQRGSQPITVRAIRTQPTQLERIVSLEEKHAKTDDRFKSIETKLDEIYTLLIQAKGVLWLGTKIAGIVTLACVVIGAIVGVVKLLQG